MKKLFSSLLLATSFLAVGASASAADIEQTRTLVWTDLTSTFNARFGDGTTGQSFLENYTFTVDGLNIAASQVTSISLGTVSSVNISSFVLTGNGTTYTGTTSVDGDTQTLTLRTSGLTSGTYTLSVAGTVTGSSGGSYAGNISIAPVPEASTTAMMLGGLALVGFAATRRRRKTGAAPSMLGSNLMAA